MVSSSAKVIQLRQLLAERFGHVALAEDKVYATAFPPLDQLGIPQGALTEIVARPTNGPGGALLLYGLLHACAGKGERVVLIDGSDCFHPQGLSGRDLNRLLWMRCHHAGEAIRVADLAIRDGNLPLILLLLTLNPISELHRIPGNAWHRLQMLAERSAATVLVFTPQAQVGCARLRVIAGGSFPLEKLHRARTELIPELDLHVDRRRKVREGGQADEDVCRALSA